MNTIYMGNIEYSQGSMEPPQNFKTDSLEPSLIQTKVALVASTQTKRGPKSQ